MNTFNTLSSTILNLHTTLQRSALQSVNRTLTIRNWIIGQHIVEYEQHGEDRAQYGENLLLKLAQSMADTRGFSERNLRLFREFYRAYPCLVDVVYEEIGKIGSLYAIPIDINGTSGSQQNWQLPTAKSDNSEIHNEFSPEPKELLYHFSFTHFAELMRIADPLKRAFYEIEGIKGNWSVSQLKRQIESLLFERTGLSKDKRGLIQTIHAQKQIACIDDILRDPYILEFTGLPEQQQFSENDLETALLDNIQKFLLELGNGFCFEARQKRITIDNEHNWIDLVFYHRILKCHILIDLKVRKFRHGDAGQMNFYLNYFRDTIMTSDDNPPVGLILCTGRDETHVRYATAGMDNHLFVSKYLMHLPSENMIREFLETDKERVVLKLREAQACYGER